jgi:ribose 5-phosphate isomerase A
MANDLHKKTAALAAIDYITPGMIVGVGTGSTVDFFIAALATIKGKLDGAVASSIATEKKLRALGIPLHDLNSLGELELYVDGADEINSYRQMIKGGGGASTREKIIAFNAKKFVCIVDESKRVDLLGKFPVAVEVLPMARSYVARQIVALGGDPVYRQGFVTDNGNIILDVFNLKMLEPLAIEMALNNICGVVGNGVFAKRTADIALMGTPNGAVKL